MNKALRNFINFWGRAITMSTYQNLPISGLIFFPWWTLMRFANFNMGLPFLPQPQLYLFQVEAEMRYQKQLLIDSSIAALDGIDQSCRFSGTSQRKPHFEDLVLSITKFQDNVKRNIKESCPTWHNLFNYKTATCVTLEKFNTLSKTVRYRVQAIRDITEIFKDQCQRIRSHVQDVEERIHNSPSSEFSYKGELTTPRPLDPYIQKTPFLIRQQNLEANGSSATKHSYFYSYDLDFKDGTPLSIIQSLVAQLCKESKDFNMVSGILYMICAIESSEAKIWYLNKDNVTGVHRSWFVQRQQEVSRYNKTKGFDEETFLKDFVNLNRAEKNSTLVK